MKVKSEKKEKAISADCIAVVVSLFASVEFSFQILKDGSMYPRFSLMFQHSTRRLGIFPATQNLRAAALRRPNSGADTLFPRGVCTALLNV